MEELFAKLQKSSNSNNPSNHNPSVSSAHHYREPSVSSPIFSPPPTGPQPHHPSTVLSPNTSAMNTPLPDGGGQPRATDLLSLLRFRQSSASAATPPVNAPNPFDDYSPSDATSGAQNRAVSAADLVAGLSRKPNTYNASPSPLAGATSRPELRGEASGSSSNPQDFLLKLLNQAPKSGLSHMSSPPPAAQMEILKHDHTSSTGSTLTANARNSSSEVEGQTLTPPDAHRETVSEAVSGVGEIVDRQIEEALAQVASKANGDSAPKISEAKKAVQEAAADIKEELKDDGKRQKLEAGMPKAAAKAFEETIAAAAEPAGADEDWEKAAEKGGRVFTLPMQPFKSIFINDFEKEPTLIPQNMTQDIAKVKRPFDQIDRNLVVATQNLMIYPLKNGGLRVIRQESGVHKEVFKNVPERIFNVSVSTKKKSTAPPTEVVLATGVEGTVFWAPLSNFASSDEVFGDNEGDRGFIFPPVPSSDENTSGGQLKTRVKPSYGHPEYFAYGRGKSIYIVYPSIARSETYSNPTTRICKSDKYLKEHMLRISTGKAGKDFIFSADDTVIISLDKAGRLKFWDIRLLTTPESDKIPAAEPLEVKVPLMTLATCPATEKSWPTSILLVDKDRPMSRGIALRYVIIGLKQNHTLQIWDLMLGKPVQEINFPHAQESDGICSVVFHAKTSILTLAHPTRNSIYFLHISIPPYNLPPMNQSRFVNMVSAKDPTLPSPQSTIIVNGIREYTFSKTSIIRSIDILAEPGAHYGDDAPVFVLYVMHSNGISELKVDRALLGQSDSGRVTDSVDASKIPGAIRVEMIKVLPAPVVGDSGSVTSESTVTAPTNGTEDARKGGKRVESTPNRGQKIVVAQYNKLEAESSNDKPEKKKKKDKKAQVSQATSPARSPFVPAAESSKPVPEVESAKARVISRKLGPVAKAVEPTEVLATANTEITVPGSTSSSSNVSTTVEYSTIEAILKTEFDSLQHGISQDRLKQDAAANSRQEAVLKAVSRTLTENVEKSLTDVVTEGLTKITINPLKEIVSSTINHTLSQAIGAAINTNTLSNAVGSAINRDLQKSLPAALSHTLSDKQVLQNVAKQISHNVAQQVDAQFANAMKITITPAISKLAVSTIQQMTSEMDRRFGDQLQLLEIQKQKDDGKIDGLYKVIDGLQQAMLAMAQTQQQFQQDTKEMLAQIQATSQAAAVVAAPSKPMTPAQPLTAADLERQDIQSDFARNEVESATMKWMQSDRKIALFDEVFVFVDPRFVHTLGPLLILSIAASVSESFNTHLRERLDWLELCIVCLDPHQSQAQVPDLEQVLPSVLGVILQRVQQEYMVVSDANHQDPILKRMHVVARNLQAMMKQAST